MMVASERHVAIRSTTGPAEPLGPVLEELGLVPLIFGLKGPTKIVGLFNSAVTPACTLLLV